MAIEAMFPLDFLMDLCILAAVQIALDRPCLRKLLSAQLLLFFATVLSIVFPACRIAYPAVFPPAAWLLRRDGNFRAILETSAAIFCAYAACAGFVVISDRNLLPVFVSLLIFGALLFRRRHIRSQWNIEVVLENNGFRRCFTALIDTGNRLKSCAGGLPILIAEEKLLGKAIEKLSPDSCVTIPYGVLGGSGEILCFKPDSIRIRCDDGSLVPAPECLAGIFPARIPGAARALAPPEFAQSADCGRSFFIPHIKFSRRYSHGVFKHKAIHLWPGCADPQGIRMLHRRQ